MNQYLKMEVLVSVMTTIIIMSFGWFFLIYPDLATKTWVRDNPPIFRYSQTFLRDIEHNSEAIDIFVSKFESYVAEMRVTTQDIRERLARIEERLRNQQIKEGTPL